MRRRLVLLGGALVLSGCAAREPMSAPPVVRGSAGPRYRGDFAFVALATALENLAVTAYDIALRRATEQRLGPVPPAVAALLRVARHQHADHAAAWNSGLSQAGQPVVTDTPVSIAEQVVAEATGAVSVVDVATLAIRLEAMAAQTYARAAGELTDPASLATAAAVAPVEAAHLAVLTLLYGHSPVPAATLGTEQALGPDALRR